MTVRGGRLGIELFDDRFVQDPYPLYERMLASGPVHPIADSGFSAVCSWDAINDVVARPEDFSSNLTATMTYQDCKVGAFAMGELGGETQALATADDPAHAAHRRLLVPQLAAKRINELELFVGETADRLWDEGMQGGTVEWMSAMANRLPMMVVTRLIGVPDVDIEQLMRWAYSSTQVVEGLVDEAQLASARVAVMELSGFISEHFQRAVAAPQDNLLSDLATACATGELGEVAAMTMMITLFTAGGESTASLIGSAAHVLANRPEIQQTVRENPDLLKCIPRRSAALRTAIPGALPSRAQRHRPVRRESQRRFSAGAAVGGGQQGPFTFRRCQ